VELGWPTGIDEGSDSSGSSAFHLEGSGGEEKLEPVEVSEKLLFPVSQGAGKSQTQ
jgi:hypothetical protein